MVAIEHPVAAAGSVAFFAIAAWFTTRAYRSTNDLGEFTTGIGYGDAFTAIGTIVPLTAAFAYMMMSLGFGTALVAGRPVAWLRYFEWGITTPLLLTGLAVLVQKQRFLLYLIGLDVTMILTGFAATVSGPPLREMALLVSTAALAALLHQLLRPPVDLDRKPERLHRLFRRLRNITAAVWLAYPLAWLASTDGYALVGLETSFLIFLALDLVAKGGYAAYVAHEARNW